MNKLLNLLLIIKKDLLVFWIPYLGDSGIVISTYTMISFSGRRVGYSMELTYF